MGIFDQFYEKIRTLLGEDESTILKKKDYYELLEINNTATEEEIKKSYRRLALKWHPDKNPGKEEECAAYFTVLQQAYETLSDPRERAFYDKHKDNILRDQDVTEERKDEGIKLFQYFQPCFRGFDDSPDGFYAVYRDIFDKLALEEYPYIDEDEREFPSFGNSDSDYDMIVGPFYDFWTNFSTSRSFAWLDKWNLREAPNRATLRAMEKENKKFREAGKQERNDEIRSLAMFIRKRDKRVKAFRETLEKRKKEVQERVEQQRRQKIRENLEKLEEHVEDEEAKAGHLKALEEIENELDAQYGITRDGDSDDDQEDETKYCVACEKSFKTSKSYLNHQKSKKHKQAVELLKKFMKEEDYALLQDEIIEEETEDNKPQRSKKKRKNKRQSPILGDDDEEIKDEQEEEKIDEITANVEEIKLENDEKSDMKKKKKKNKNNIETSKKPEDTVRPKPSECIICGLEFDSRSKLFRHIEATGHAALKDVSTTVNNQKNKKKNKK